MGRGLLCVGLTTLDIAARPIDALPAQEGTTLVEQIVLSPAGTAGGAALVAATLGVATQLASAVGDDNAGRLVRMALDDRGVDTALLAALPGRPTSTTILAIDSAGRRPNFHALGASGQMEIGPATIAAACAARFVHYAGVGAPRLDGGPGADLLARARAAGAVVTCDLISPRRSALDELKRLLPHVDYFMPSAAEARLLSGRDDLAEAARFVQGLGARTCIVKDGARGALIVDSQGVQRLPAHAVAPVDTTSCGDSFCAGFICGLDRGWSVGEAARLAAAVAALVAQGVGTLGNLEGFDDAERLMREGALKELKP